MRKPVKKRQQLSELSFKIWLIDIATRVANRLGYHIQNIAVLIIEMNSSIKKGFNAGRDEAKKEAFNTSVKELIENESSVTLSTL